ncbi:hypothetical protein JTB14_029471 [Gonioctena quinquepunctata]|nr:hypothetical protein JTB14_029471 [Gonioctena quinquepunctata]
MNFYEANNDEALASGSAIPRRDLLRRTSPRARTHSSPKQMGKRKRLERVESPEKEQEKPNNQDTFKNIMEQMSKHIRQLEKVVQDMYKPKKEITDISGKLILQLEKLQKVEMRN